MTDPLDNSRMSWTGRREAIAAIDIRIWPAGVIEFREPVPFSFLPRQTRFSHLEDLFPNGEFPDGV